MISYVYLHIIYKVYKILINLIKRNKDCFKDIPIKISDGGRLMLPRNLNARRQMM